MPKELMWRVIATAIFAGTFGWSLASGKWAIAGVTGFLGLWTLAFLILGFVAWRRGLLSEHS